MTQIDKKEFERQVDHRPDYILPFQAEPGTEQLLSEYIDRKHKGVKFDYDKPRMDLVPAEAIKGMAEILTFGAEKYGAHNWEYGMDWHRAFAAAQRHLWDWWNGEDTDPETGKSHVDHALCCIAFLSTYEKRGVGNDDRFRGA